MENTIEYIILLLTNALELYIIYRFMVIFFCDFAVQPQMVLIAYLFRYILTSVVMVGFSYPILNVISGLGSLFVITLCYKSTTSKRIITTIIIYMCLFFVEALVAVVIGLSGFNVFEKSELSNSFMSIIIEILFWLLSVVLGKFKNMKVNMPIPKYFVVAIIIVPLTSIFLELLIFQQENVNRIISAISLMCLLSSNFVMIYLYDSLARLFEEKTKSEIVRREKTYYHAQSELLQRNHEELRQFRHDIKNKLQVIKSMLEQEKTEKIYEYISHMTEKLDETEMYSQSGNVVIDSIVNYKLNRAREMGVDIKSNIVIPSEIEIEDDDIVIILGNLLDNAIEATERIKDNKYVDLNFEYNKNCAFITVKNSFDNVIHMINGKIKTRKEDDAMHGIGLRSVEAALEKYNGIINFEHDNKEFIANVILYV